MKKERIKFECLKCGAELFFNKRECKDGMNCPACRGALIDTGVETLTAYSDGPKQPLLTIELQDETSVPKVVYKGKEIPLNTHIHFDWDTDTDEHGGLTYAIEHMETGNKVPVNNRIERRVKGHAID